MSDLMPIAISIITVTSTIIAIFLGIRTLSKGPHIIFSLFKKAEISIYNEDHEENITLLTAPIGNKKKSLFGETAKKVSAMVIYRAPVNDEQLGLNANLSLPWVDSYGIRTRVDGQLKSEKDIRNALENHFFDWTERDIPQGRGEHLVVAYGIEKVNKLFFATNPPIEIPLPKKQGRGFSMCFLRLEIAGENLKSTLSEGTLIMGNSWNNFTFPKKMTTVKTTSKIGNLLLRLGIGREVKVLGSKSSCED